MTPGPWLLFAALFLAGGMILGPRLPRLWVGLTLAGSGSALVASLLVLGGAAAGDWRSGFAVAGQPLPLRLGGLGAWFLALLGLVAGAGAAYARGYWRDREHPDSAPRGRGWWNAMVLSMALVLLSADGLHFLIAWELFAVSGYFLIALDRDRCEARTAGWVYLAASHLGTLSLFAFFTALAWHRGSWELGPMRGDPSLAPLFWLALAGFGVKAGLFPLHLWLPSAHANAPSHVSALMSGLALKIGVYGIIRFGGWLPAPPGAGWALIGIGGAGALLGVGLAFAQGDLKRLLAYCSVENLGIIAIGCGGALLGAAHGDAAWGRLLLAGALLQVWNHGLLKPLLFFGSGSVAHATGTRDMSRLGGLARRMPWTSGLFALGATGISGLPPLGGVVGEWLIYLGLFDAAASRGASPAVVLPAAIALAAAGALALATFVKAGGVVFLGAPRTRGAADARECGREMLGAMLVLAAGCLVLGLAPIAVWPLLRRAVGAWDPAWSSAPLPAPLLTLSLVQAALAVLFFGGAAWLRRRVRASGPRRAPSWTCGYAAPSARMQYSGGSFSSIVSGWASGILGPLRTVRRPQGPFPARAVWIERCP